MQTNLVALKVLSTFTAFKNGYYSYLQHNNAIALSILKIILFIQICFRLLVKS